MPRFTSTHVKRTKPDIGQLRERVVISTTLERPDPDVSTTVLRPGVFRAQARIRQLREEQILGYLGVFGTELKPPVVEVVIRWPTDAKVDINHWVYHCDRHTGIETWYKVRTLEDLDGVHRWLTLNCSVDGVRDKRSDPATQPLPQEWHRPREDELLVDTLG